MKRSPLTWLSRATQVPLDINHGVHDGRTGSVPFPHSLLAFNCLAAEEDRLPEQEIASYYETQQRPQGWSTPGADPLYGSKTVMFRKISGNARVTLFDGGHEILYLPSLNWLARQRKGQPAVWKIENASPIHAENTRSGL